MDGPIPHLLKARIASAVIALGSFQAIALDHSVHAQSIQEPGVVAPADCESQVVIFNSVPVTRTGTSASWISMTAFSVLCALGAGVWWRGHSKRISKKIAGAIAGRGSIEILDRTVMAKGQSLSLVKVGDRVVLLGQSTQGFQRLAEFDANESQSTALVAAQRRVG